MLPGITSPHSILIVDDDAVTRKLARNILEGAGYSVSEAGSVYAALKMSSTNAPHLVVLDLAMPEQDGFEFLAARQANPLLASVPVIVLSGTEDLRDAHRSMAEGANEFLSKPIEAARLLRKVRKHLRDRKFLVAQFGPSGPSVTVSLPADVIMANASQCAVAVSARVAPDGEATAGVRLRGWDLVEKAGASSEQLKRSRQPARSVGPARYVASFNLVGLTREQTEKFSLLLKGPK